MKWESRHAQQMYIGQVRIKRPIVDTAWYPAHIFEHGYQLIIGRSSTYGHYANLAIAHRPLHVQSLLCECKIRARSCCQPVRPRWPCRVQRQRATYARHIIKLKKDVTQMKQNSKQKLFYFISKSSKLVLFYCHFKYLSVAPCKRSELVIMVEKLVTSKVLT